MNRAWLEGAGVRLTSFPSFWLPAWVPEQLLALCVFGKCHPRVRSQRDLCAKQPVTQPAREQIASGFGPGAASATLISERHTVPSSRDGRVTSRQARSFVFLDWQKEALGFPRVPREAERQLLPACDRELAASESGSRQR